MTKPDADQLNSAAGRFLRDHWPVFAWSLVFLFVAGGLQFYFTPFVEGDAPYHAAVGKLIRQNGILYEFPWTPFSWLSDRYADDRLLFHLLYVPFANLDWITAARIVGTIAGAAILIALYLVLRAEQIRFAGLWTLIPLTGSVLFISRFMLVRPHLLSIALALLFLWAAARGRLAILAAVSFLYPLTYIAFWQLPCLLLIAAETARFLARKPIRWKPAAVVVCGIALGIAVHPNTLNLIAYNWIVMVDVLVKNTWLAPVGIDMGRELNTYPLGGWIQGLSVSALMTAAAAVYGWRYRREDLVLLAFALAALGFCVLTIRSARFAEYFVPFSVAAFATASRFIAWRFLAPSLLAISLAYTMFVGSFTFSQWSRETNPMPPSTAARFQQLIPPGSRVFTTRWDYTGLLMVALPERYFLVALDPTLFFLKDPELYRLWYRIAHEPTPGIADIIRKRFGSRYVVVNNPPASQHFNHQLSTEPGVRVILSLDRWLVFDLGPASTPERLGPGQSGR
ncbi:MAG: hypothetical protein JRF15_14080 [Deltaproteobacteria bacterium]|jgi:hypothetical protein|nr:hypothetical protein [Deltaproteobacteria bacterium]